MTDSKRRNRKKKENIPPSSTLASQEIERRTSEEAKNQKTTANPDKKNAEQKGNHLAGTWTRKEKIDTTIQACIALAAAASVILVYLMTSGQIREYRKTARTELRAYVMPLSPIQGVRFGKQVVSLPIVNFGKTPAFRYYPAIIYERCDTLTLNPNDFLSEPHDNRTRWLVPSSPDTVLVQAKFWNDKGMFYYVYGKIWYDDVMGNQDSTVFAFQYEFFRGSWVRLAGYDYAN